MAANTCRMFSSSRSVYGILRQKWSLSSFRYVGIGNLKYSTAAKPYIFHPKTKTLESEVQAFYLTKSILMEGLPTFVTNSNFDPSSRDELLSRFRQCVIQTRIFNYEGERSTKITCAMPLMQNMMKVVWSLADRFPGLLEMSLSYKPHVSAIWPRGDEQVQVSGNLGFLLSSKRALKPFAADEEICATEGKPLGNVDIIAPVFNLYQLETKGEIDTGFYAGAPYPHAHTLMLVNTEKDWSMRDISAQGLMFTFGRLVAEAICNHGNKMGEPLKESLAAQCIMSNGIRLSYLCYQLNTLDLQSDSGVKNMAWLLPGVQMYEIAKLEEITSQRDLDPVTYEARVEGFNSNSFEMFTNMMLNGTQEV